MKYLQRSAFGIKTCGREDKKAELIGERGYSVMYASDKLVQLHQALLMRIVPRCTEMIWTLRSLNDWPSFVSCHMKKGQLG